MARDSRKTPDPVEELFDFLLLWEENMRKEDKPEALLHVCSLLRAQIRNLLAKIGLRCVERREQLAHNEAEDISHCTFVDEQCPATLLITVKEQKGKLLKRLSAQLVIRFRVLKNRSDVDDVKASKVITQVDQL